MTQQRAMTQRAITQVFVKLLILLMIALASCRPARDRDELVIAVDAPVKDLDPRLAVDGPSARLSRLIFQGLTAVDDHGTPYLDLADALTPDGDPLVIRAHLRSTARFHNGTPVTAADVAFTYQTVLDPAFGTPITGEFRKRFSKVEADPRDPLTVRFYLRRPLATLWTDVVLGIAPAHLLRDQPGRRFAGVPIGSGPWRVVGPASGERVSVARVATQRGATQGFVNYPQRLTFVAIADEGARALSVLGGGADVAWTGLSPAILHGSSQHGGAQLLHAAGIGWVYLGLNLRQPPLDDPRVRRAIALGLDRDTVIATLLGGLARPADGMFAPGHWAREDVPDLPHDPSRAVALLDAAGLRPGPDGVRLRLEIKVSTSRLRRSVGRALAEQLRPLGIEATVRPFELATFLADVRAGRFQAFLLQLPEPFEPDQLGWMFHSANAAVKTPDPQSTSAFARLDRRGLTSTVWAAEVSTDPACRDWPRRVLHDATRAFVLAPLGLAEQPGSGNRTGYADPRLDCWVDRGAQTLDRPARQALYGAAQRKLADDLPVIPLWWEDQAVLVAPGVTLPPLAADGRYSILAGARREPPAQ